MKKVFRIAVLPGDGIGPEVMSQATRVLQLLNETLREVKFQLTEYACGAGEYKRSGNPLPDEVFTACRDADAVLLGAMGLPDVRWPNGKEMTPQIDLREKLDLYRGLRPIRLFHAQDTPLKDRQPGEIDFVIVRENTEGLFSARLSQRDPAADEVRDVMRISRHGAERIARAAFELALDRRRRVALIDKANVLPSMVFFREVFDAVALEFPEVETEHVYVDAAAYYLVARPQRFDVMVTENMFGDILSDLAAGLVGGLGMAPSADIGDDCAVFQPSHGSAPDIAGTGTANPLAMILSTAMMLEWLQHPETKAAARQIHDAVASVMQHPGHRTRDMGGDRTTWQMGDLIVQALQAPCPSLTPANRQ